MKNLLKLIRCLFASYYLKVANYTIFGDVNVNEDEGRALYLYSCQVSPPITSDSQHEHCSNGLDRLHCRNTYLRNR